MPRPAIRRQQVPRSSTSSRSRPAPSASKASRTELNKVLAVGSGGSNQILATVAMSEYLRERQRRRKGEGNSRPTLPRATAIFASEDKADLDNTLNLLSNLSFLSGRRAYTWGTPLSTISELLGSLFSSSSVVLPPGGNSPLGVLGQISGALELAEQIARGEMPDPDAIYLPVGSSCTISGLIRVPSPTVPQRHVCETEFPNMRRNDTPCSCCRPQAFRNANGKLGQEYTLHDAAHLPRSCARAVPSRRARPARRRPCHAQQWPGAP